jgi:phosphoribosylanthranilate isomerase
MTRIKICGITNYKDAQVAVAAGADALGFVFAPSPRQVTPTTAQKIIVQVPPLITTVGVFVDEDVETIREIIEQCPLHMVQLHGAESPASLAALGGRALKAFRVRDAQVLAEIKRFGSRHFLLDAFVDDVAGGTGTRCDWSIAHRATGLGKLILAGGLHPDNIREALAQVRPYGVDVSSGVEQHPGRKDHERLHAFIHEVRKWDCQTQQDTSANTAAVSFPKR